MKPKSTIKRNLEQLRVIIRDSDDACERRIAYAMHHAIRWATMETWLGTNG